MRRGAGTIRLAMAFVLLFASLSMVVWRQSRALEQLRSLEQAREERALLTAEWSELQREIQHLESRTRIVEVAGERLGMRPAVHSEINLRLPPAHVVASSRVAADAVASSAGDR